MGANRLQPDNFQPTIDAHQHFWKFDPVRDNWITDEMSVIRKDFLPRDLAPILRENNIDGCVAVQADQSENETKFLLDLAKQNDFIKGVVGWVDLCDEKIDAILSYYRQFKLLKGFRHILQGENDRAFMLRSNFLRGIAALKEFDFTYDILIFPDQLKYINEFVEKFPGQRFVIDHIAKPDIKNHEINEWKAVIMNIAQNENVFCKISGLVTEADLKNWKQEDFIPYLEVIISAFGMDRIMYGSDWPVCLLAGSYNEVMNIARNYFSSFTVEEREKFFGLNAIEFYNLK
jgi:L-fuconolactonase